MNKITVFARYYTKTWCWLGERLNMRYFVLRTSTAYVTSDKCIETGLF